MEDNDLNMIWELVDISRVGNSRIRVFNFILGMNFGDI